MDLVHILRIQNYIEYHTIEEDHGLFLPQAMARDHYKTRRNHMIAVSNSSDLTYKTNLYNITTCGLAINQLFKVLL